MSTTDATTPTTDTAPTLADARGAVHDAENKFDEMMTPPEGSVVCAAALLDAIRDAVPTAARTMWRGAVYAVETLIDNARAALAAWEEKMEAEITLSKVRMAREDKGAAQRKAEKEQSDRISIKLIALGLARKGGFRTAPEHIPGHIERIAAELADEERAPDAWCCGAKAEILAHVLAADDTVVGRLARSLADDLARVTGGSYREHTGPARPADLLPWAPAVPTDDEVLPAA